MPGSRQPCEWPGRHYQRARRDSQAQLAADRDPCVQPRGRPAAPAAVAGPLSSSTAAAASTAGTSGAARRGAAAAAALLRRGAGGRRLLRRGTRRSKRRPRSPLQHNNAVLLHHNTYCIVMNQSGCARQPVCRPGIMPGLRAGTPPQARCGARGGGGGWAGYGTMRELEILHYITLYYICIILYALYDVTEVPRRACRCRTECACRR